MPDPESLRGKHVLIVDDVVTQATALQTFSYTRQYEADADLRSVGMMVQAGRNPIAFVDLLDRITKEKGASGKTGWFDTHPGTNDRRDSVTKEAVRLGWKG